VVNFDRLRLIPRHTITPDLPIESKYGKCIAGRKTKVTMNHCGAICGKDSAGEWLGIKPGEFDFVCPYADGPTVLRDNHWHIEVTDSRLWVRERFQPIWESEDTPGDWDTGKGYKISYPATDGIQEWVNMHSDDERITTACKPSIHMPRWASRITLEVVAVRVERAQEINEEDAIAEGVGYGWQMNVGWPDYLHISEGRCALTQDTAAQSFGTLWDSINAKRDGGAYSWARNPWVWVVEFRRQPVSHPVDPVNPVQKESSP